MYLALNPGDGLPAELALSIKDNYWIRHRANPKASLFDSEFMDVGIFEPANLSTPRHIIEVKSITADNIESQVEKGLVQLARSQFYFGTKDVSYHLVLQKADLTIPDWLMAISVRLNVSVHWIDLSVAGPDFCPGLFKSL